MLDNCVLLAFIFVLVSLRHLMTLFCGGVVTQSVECRTCDDEVKGLTPGWALLHCNLCQVIHTGIPLITKQYNLSLA